MKKTGMLLGGGLIGAAILLLLACVGNCTVYQASEDPALFGNLSQQELTIVAAYGDSASGPTAAVNALVYLQRKYAAIYRTTLVPAYDTAALATTAVKLGRRDYMSILTPMQIYGLSNGVTTSVFLNGNYAYVGSNTATSAFKVFDISEPAALTLLGSTGGLGIGYVTVIYVSNYAFVGWNNATIRIYDISNPASPAEISTINYGYGQTYALYASGNLLYVGANSGAGQEFRIYDISNIASPSLVSATDVGGDIFSLYIAGNYAYLGTGANYSYFQIYDISNPAQPLLVSSTNVGPVTNAVEIRGIYAYLGLNNGPSRFQIFDISDPGLPAPKSAAVTPTQVNNLAIVGNYAYLGMGGRNIYPAISVYDISNPASPNFIASSDNTVDVNSLAVRGNLAYLGTGTGDPLSFRIYSLNHTYRRDFIWGIHSYLRQSNTVFEGQQTDPGTYGPTNPGGWGWNQRVRPIWVNEADSYPGWNFLYNKLTAGQAVEIAWQGQDAAGKVHEHYLTLTGLYFNDADNNGIIEYDENALISYIDPKDGKGYSTHLWQDAAGNLILAYHNATYDWFTGDVRLDLAMSQGPRAVSAPFLMLLLED